MKDAPYITYLLIAANVIFSIYGFSNQGIISKYVFNVGAILKGKEWVRMFSSAFLHADFIHLAFNMIALYSIGSLLEASPAVLHGYPVGLGPLKYIILYVGAMLFGNFLALLAHRNHPYYSAYGASGAVSGLIFSFVILSPTSTLAFFFIPMPAWVFGILYTAFSIWGVRSRIGNVGHEAHLGGALGGMLIYLLYKPYLFLQSPLLITALVVPILALAVAVYVKPQWFKSVIKSPGSRPFTVINPDANKKTKDDRLTFDRNPNKELEHELNAYLEKIKRFGYDGLSTEEKNRLKELSDLLGRK